MFGEIILILIKNTMLVLYNASLQKNEEKNQRSSKTF